MCYAEDFTEKIKKAVTAIRTNDYVRECDCGFTMSVIGNDVYVDIDAGPTVKENIQIHFPYSKEVTLRQISRKLLRELISFVQGIIDHGEETYASDIHRDSELRYYDTFDRDMFNVKILLESIKRCEPLH